MTKLGLGLLALLASIASPAAATIRPKPGAGDPHIQTVIYDDQQVVSLSVAMGYALTVEMALDERVENVAVGNAGAWQVTANKSADRVFVKPLQMAPGTNMSIVTDSRTYIFELSVVSAPSAETPFLLRLLHPVPALAETGETGSAAKSAAYVYKGPKSLKPQSAQDDGHTTTIVWGEGVLLPAVYAVQAGGGDEALVNGMVRDGKFVIDGVAARFVFRRGDEHGVILRRPARSKSR